ncbi:sigma-70 family RNA polymerase sigma factor [Bacillus massiliglaciei]|uniref:sigma-70 family RNA polymerase sigma factor n=1 Tax=Bacillus massiliglaciei TaxID=1816693 RepID=UPI000DA61E3E|nr:sigma-70 family RNA polymerase sigma factor [Bacillus massiliglaciei]
MKSQTAQFFSESFERLVNQHSNFFEQPIIQLFLHDEERLDIFTKALEQPTASNIQELNESFQVFYYRARIYKYLCSLIYYFSIDFDKRLRKQRERFPIILDQTFDGNLSISERIGYIDPQLEKIGETATLSSLVSDEGLLHAIRKLTDKQEKILTLSFFFGFSNKDIAAYYGETPQNISSIRKQALKKLRNNFRKGNYSGKKEKHCG